MYLYKYILVCLYTYMYTFIYTSVKYRLLFLYGTTSPLISTRLTKKIQFKIHGIRLQQHLLLPPPICNDWRTLVIDVLVFFLLLNVRIIMYHIRGSMSGQNRESPFSLDSELVFF